MDIKWKKFSYSLTATVIAFIITVLCYSALLTIASDVVVLNNSNLHIAYEESYYLSSNYINESNDIAQSLRAVTEQYKSEENILNGGTLSEDQISNREDQLYSDFENKFTESSSKIYKNLNSDDNTSDWEIDVTSGSSWTSPDGRTEIKKRDGKYYIYETAAETAYVNKGENLGYPLDPNSQELLVQVDLGLPKGWTAQVQAKYQARSGQYGYTVEQFMDYGDHRNYDPKEFWANTFKHTFSLLFKGTKKLTDMPIELIGSYRFTSVWERPITTPGSFDGRNTGFGSWDDPVYDHIVQVGARIFL